MDTPEPADNTNSSPDAEALLAELRQEVNHIHQEIKHTHRLGGLSCIVAILALLAIPATIVLLFHWLGEVHELLYTTLVIPAILGLIFIVALLTEGFDDLSPIARRRRKIKELNQKIQGLCQKLNQDVRIVGILANVPYENYITDILELLLYRLKASDARFFTNEDMEALLSILDPPIEPPIPKRAHLILALLKGLEQIGDQRAVERVKRWAAQMQAPSIQKAAEACLPFLLARAAANEQASTLLRPSSAVSDAPETLLRPAAGVTDEGQEQLLRPVE